MLLELIFGVVGAGDISLNRIEFFTPQAEAAAIGASYLHLGPAFPGIGILSCAAASGADAFAGAVFLIDPGSGAHT